jgi:hypothetical protein
MQPTREEAATPQPAPASTQGHIPEPGSRTRDIAASAEGYEAQEALTRPPPERTPRPAEAGAGREGQAASVEAGGPLAAAAEPLEAAEPLSPIRAELMRQFELLEGKGVGMKEFDGICSESTWRAAKAREQAAKAAAEAKFADALGAWQALPDAERKKKPKPRMDVVPVYTTCIDTMGLVARAAWKASGLAVRRVGAQKFDQFAFGAASRIQASRIDAWVEASPGSGLAPKPGDMLMLEKAGPKLDRLVEEGRGIDLNGEAKRKRLERELANLEKASTSANVAFAASAQTKAVQVTEALAKLKTDLEAARADLATRLAEAQAGLADRVAGGERLAFSHVGFFKGREPELGPDGAPTGREIWSTFDGGQSQIKGAIDGQGAKSGRRIYDPATNMIAGEASQGGAMRWLAGWVDVDRMVKQTEG